MVNNLTKDQPQVGKTQPYAEEAYAEFEDGYIITLKGFNKKVANALFRHLDVWSTGGYTDIVEVSREIDYRYVAWVNVMASFDINKKGHVRLPLVTVLDYPIFDINANDDVPNASVVINEREVGRILQKLIQDNLDVLL